MRMHLAPGLPFSCLQTPSNAQGGLPTFLDVGSSFSASEVSEDNLLAQLKVAGERARSTQAPSALRSKSGVPRNPHSFFLSRSRQPTAAGSPVLWRRFGCRVQGLKSLSAYVGSLMVTAVGVMLSPPLPAPLVQLPFPVLWLLLPLLLPLPVLMPPPPLLMLTLMPPPLALQ